MPPSPIATLRLIFLGSLATLVTFGSSVAAEAVGPLERSRGDPRVFTILAHQGIEPKFVLERGTTMTKICEIRHADGRPSYELYWLEHLTQAAIVVHGRAEIIAISHTGDVLGTYDSSMSEYPRCVGRNRMVRTVDDVGKHVTAFSPNRLPHWLGGGSGFFYAAPRFATVSDVDGVKFPPPMHWPH